MQDPAYQLQAVEGIPNGEVGAMDLGKLQKEKQDLEQQLLEKNKVRMFFTQLFVSLLLPHPVPQIIQSLLGEFC